MPRCENEQCGREELSPDELHEDLETGGLFCGDCAEDKKIVKVPNRQDLVLGREFDYDVSYTRKDGLKAGVRLGGAKLSLEVDAGELNRTFGPEE